MSWVFQPSLQFSLVAYLLRLAISIQASHIPLAVPCDLLPGSPCILQAAHTGVNQPPHCESYWRFWNHSLLSHLHLVKWFFTCFLQEAGPILTWCHYNLVWKNWYNSYFFVAWCPQLEILILQLKVSSGPMSKALMIPAHNQGLRSTLFKDEEMRQGNQDRPGQLFPLRIPIVPAAGWNLHFFCFIFNSVWLRQNHLLLI